MHDAASFGKIGSLVTIEADLEREFDERLRDCSTLAGHTPSTPLDY